MPRKITKPKSWAGFKNEVKLWAAKAPRVFTIKERPISSPSMVRLPMDSFKEAVVSLIHNSNPSLSTRVPITQPFLVKNKKHLPKSLAPDILHKCATPSGVVGSDKKSNSPPLTHFPLPQSEPNQPNLTTFELLATANVENDLLAESKDDRRLHAQFIREKSLADENMVPDDGQQSYESCRRFRWCPMMVVM